MRIDDRRQTSAGWIDAIYLVKRILNALPPDLTAGVRRVCLLDHHLKLERALGRYVPATREKGAEIELYFWRFDGLPPPLRDEEFYHTYILALTLCHELYHHRIRMVRGRRLPKRSKEERQAREWAYGKAMGVINCYYTPTQLVEMEEKVKVALLEATSALPDPITGRNLASRTL